MWFKEILLGHVLAGFSLCAKRYVEQETSWLYIIIALQLFKRRISYLIFFIHFVNSVCFGFTESNILFCSEEPAILVVDMFKQSLCIQGIRIANSASSVIRICFYIILSSAPFKTKWLHHVSWYLSITKSLLMLLPSLAVILLKIPVL